MRSETRSTDCGFGSQRSVSGGALRGRILRTLLAGLVLVAPTQLKADYRIGAGDKLEISVVGIPELQRRTVVEADGTISFPLLGTLPVSGLSLPETRARITAGLASKIYRTKSSDGSEQAYAIGLNEITVAVAEYRPVYVKGGVARAGEYAYRPSLTVREVVALAGGYDILPVKVSNPYLEAADFRSEYESLWLEFAKEQARIWRLKAELESREAGVARADRDTVARTIPIDAPISRAMIAKIVTLATDQFNARQEDYTRQKAFLQKSIEQMNLRIETVSQREEREAKGAADDVRDLERTIALYKQGTLINNRVIEARRNVLLSTTRKLETTAELMQMRQQKTDLVRQLDRFADERRIAVLQELEVATVRLGDIRTKLQGTGEKLQYAAIAKAQITDGDRKLPVITIHRKDLKGWQRLTADESVEVQPGDVIEITVSR